MVQSDIFILSLTPGALESRKKVPVSSSEWMPGILHQSGQQAAAATSLTSLPLAFREASLCKPSPNFQCWCLVQTAFPLRAPEWQPEENWGDYSQGQHLGTCVFLAFSSCHFTSVQRFTVSGGITSMWQNPLRVQLKPIFSMTCALTRRLLLISDCSKFFLQVTALTCTPSCMS